MKWIIGLELDGHVQQSDGSNRKQICRCCWQPLASRGTNKIPLASFHAKCDVVGDNTRKWDEWLGNSCGRTKRANFVLASLRSSTASLPSFQFNSIQLRSYRSFEAALSLGWSKVAFDVWHLICQSFFQGRCSMALNAEFSAWECVLRCLIMSIWNGTTTKSGTVLCFRQLKPSVAFNLTRHGGSVIKAMLRLVCVDATERVWKMFIFSRAHNRLDSCPARERKKRKKRKRFILRSRGKIMGLTWDSSVWWSNIYWPGHDCKKGSENRDPHPTPFSRTKFFRAETFWRPSNFFVSWQGHV